MRYHDKEDDLLELIPCYIEKICHIPFEPQIIRGKMGGKFLKKYKMLDPEVRPYLINSFRLIGWPDPFPKGKLMMNNDKDLALNKQIAKEPLTLIYPEARIKQKNSPIPIFIPNAAVMWKMMRACIGCEWPGDLWFNLKPEDCINFNYTDEEGLTGTEGEDEY